MLTVRHLVKKFPAENKTLVTAVNDLCFSVQSGEVFGLLGPNGAGKTTTLRMLATLTPPDAGHIQIGACDSATDPLGVRRQLAYVPAEAGLPERLTPREVVVLFARIQGVKQPRERAEDLLTQLGAISYADKPCGELSTGMRRRVVLARALVHNPTTLLLDEPTDGLDVSGRQDVLGWVKEQAGLGCTVVLSSHIMGEVEQVVDRIGILHHGRLVAEGDMAHILSSSGCSTLNEAFLALTETG